jgi:hypothetical protein
MQTKNCNTWGIAKIAMIAITEKRSIRGSGTWGSSLNYGRYGNLGILTM